MAALVFTQSLSNLLDIYGFHLKILKKRRPLSSANSRDKDKEVELRTPLAVFL
jgi:hypothetical protein